MTDEHGTASRWGTPSGITLAVVLAIGGFFLLTEHAAHVLGVLPYVLLLACPLMHRFIHRGHRGRDGHGAGHAPPERSRVPWTA